MLSIYGQREFNANSNHEHANTGETDSHFERTVGPHGISLRTRGVWRELISPAVGWTSAVGPVIRSDPQKNGVFNLAHGLGAYL